jgi:hypothetical protein
MILEAVVGIEHAGDAALGQVAIRLVGSILGDNDDRQFGIDGQRGTKPRQSAADD